MGWQRLQDGAWVLEKAAGARFADLVSRELWQPMGAEHDAEITVDAHGNALAEGGLARRYAMRAE